MPTEGLACSCVPTTFKQCRDYLLGNESPVCTISDADFHDNAQWTVSEVSKLFVLPLKFKAYNNGGQNLLAAVFFIDYDFESPYHGRLLDMALQGDVTVVRCDGQDLDRVFFDWLVQHIVAFVKQRETFEEALKDSPDEQRRVKRFQRCFFSRYWMASAYEWRKFKESRTDDKNPLVTDDNAALLSKICWHCRIDEEEQGSKMMMCSACKAASYCSKECQKEGWKGHKERCKAIFSCEYHGI